MDFAIQGSRPIWQQLTEQLARRIITGAYPLGSRFPAVRELAAEAGVNPNTMQRAITQLENARPRHNEPDAGPHRDGKRRGARGDAAAAGRGMHGKLFQGNGSAGLFPRRGRGYGAGGKGKRMMNEELVKCTGLCRSFEAVQALRGVDLSLTSGKIVGLLGPNGSGKTTLIKILNGLLQPTAGEARVAGLLPGVETKAITSYLPDRGYFPPTGCASAI